MKKFLLLALIWPACFFTACSENSSDPMSSNASAPMKEHESNNPTYRIVPKGDFKGHSWGEWAGKWWNWALQMPSGHNAVEGTAPMETNQGGDVWFLAGNFSGGTVTRSIVVPHGKALLLPVINFYADTTGGFPPISQLDQITQSIWDGSAPRSESAEIDGHSVANISTNYFAPVTDFTVHNLPKNNVIGDNTYGKNKIKTHAASCGDYLMIDDLSKGNHTIHFKGATSYGFSMDMTYHISVQ